MIALDMMALMQSAPASATAPAQAYLLSTENVFLLFFIMLGPLKAIGPFFVATRQMQPGALRTLAFKVFTLSALAVLLAGVLGSAMLRKWQITPEVMQFAGGLVFLLVALQMTLSQYQAHPAPAENSEAPEVMRLVFPVTVSPYGVAAIISLMALSADMHRSLVVLGLAMAVMVLNLLAMLAVRPIMRWIGPVPLQILGAVLGMLQVALALQLIIGALRDLGWQVSP